MKVNAKICKHSCFGELGGNAKGFLSSGQFVTDAFRQKLYFTSQSTKIAFCATLWRLRGNVRGSSMALCVVDVLLVLIKLFRGFSGFRGFRFLGRPRKKRHM